MMREEGTVIALEGDLAVVLGQRKKSCGNCAGESSCTTLSVGAGKRENQFRAVNRAGAKVGERVVLEISEKVFLKASGMLYGLPLLALIRQHIVNPALLLTGHFNDDFLLWHLTLS